jgi:hypothetical protein
VPLFVPVRGASFLIAKVTVTVPVLIFGKERQRATEWHARAKRKGRVWKWNDDITRAIG